ncbi:hypothetical protein RHGRI_002396 [Rhododendron griersonianum]|uniref:Uncharacterized protein n=1 Tax=Rhododendron griersonianum TaxID=479676 RepID=A0AAV6LPS4_9ERIC|nr:hypothetical protein RHGRI_002396 [Rhododendron griersonianum]
MENTKWSKSTPKKNQTLPPRRGEIKLRIIGKLLKSVASVAGGNNRRKGEKW